MSYTVSLVVCSVSWFVPKRGSINEGYGPDVEWCDVSCDSGVVVQFDSQPGDIVFRVCDVV